MKNTKLQEELFQSHIESEKKTGTRTMCLLGSLLYLIFIVVDLFSLSATLSEVLIIRGAVVAVLLSAVILSYTSIFNVFIKYYNLTFSTLVLVAAAGIEAMIYIAQPADHAYHVYFVGLLLVILTIFSWSHFKLITSIILTTLIITPYAYIALSKGISASSLFVNIIFLLSAATIAFTAQIIRDRYIRENFLLQQSLKEAVKEKTIEAKDNAYLANHDALTLLPNRRYITELLEESLQIAKEKDKVLAILFLDLNGFKQINDTHGHAVGDEVLIIVAKRLELAIRRGDHISRLSGDEYLVSLMMDKENLSEIKKMAEKFTAIISEPMNIDGVRIKVGASIGIAAYPMHGDKIHVLMDIADKKMYQVKQGLQEVARDRENKPISNTPPIESLDLLPSHSK